MAHAKHQLELDKHMMGLRVLRQSDSKNMVQGGIKITHVEALGLWDTAGAAIGDVITSINRQVVATNSAMDQVIHAISLLPMGSTIQIKVSRNTRHQFFKKLRVRQFVLVPQGKDIEWVDNMIRISSGKVTLADHLSHSDQK